MMCIHKRTTKDQAPRAGCTSPVEVSNAELLAWMDEVERLEPGEVRKFVIQPLEAQRFSALASMAELGQARTLQTLLRAGANPRLGDRAHGRLPIHLAAWKGHAAVLEALNVDCVDESEVRAAYDLFKLDRRCCERSTGISVDKFRVSPN